MNRSNLEGGHMGGREPKVVIIGAGVAGIATAATLREAGFTDLTVLEKGTDVGGVWHWNRYPGLTCDVPSQMYQFSFAPKPDWSRVFAPGEEIQRYLRDVVDRLDLARHLRLGAEVVGAEFTGAGWRISVADGSTLEADFLIAATGVLHHPFTPDIPAWTPSPAGWCTPPAGPRTSPCATGASPSSAPAPPACRSYPRCSPRPPTWPISCGRRSG